ncbi:11920_t:CDS:1 [Ambispora leptoticha]|uniref:11920_t:CDS:1 n=1 Tax=Ambispora leptoticha TaxID=144679 RepID=A0A9N8V4W6_9GLOM|nr:11920_t:CDS:1 [Ambispora leptoticha]
MAPISIFDKLPTRIQKLAITLCDLVKEECPHLKLIIDHSLVTAVPICVICEQCIFDDNEYVEYQEYPMHLQCSQLHDVYMDLDTLEMTEMTNQSLNIANFPPEITNHLLEITNQSIGIKEGQPGVGEIWWDPPPGLTVKPVKPLEITNHPLGITNHPLEITNHPLGITNHPLDITNHPLEITNHPLEITNHLLGITNHPLGITNHPLEIKNHPLELMNHPLEITSYPTEISDRVMEFDQKFRQAAIKFRKNGRLPPILIDGSPIDQLLRLMTTIDQLLRLITMYDEFAGKKNKNQTKLYLLAKMGKLIVQQPELEDLVPNPERKKTKRILRVSKLLYELFPTQYELLRHAEQISCSELNKMNNNQIKQLQRIVDVWSSFI